MTPCTTCNAPMAVDQRYCLECGSRAGEARLPFLDLLRADPGTEVMPYDRPPASAWGPAPPAFALPPRVPTAQERLQANSGLIAGVGVLLLAMLIGVLIGSGLGNDGSQAAAAPAPIVVGGLPAAAATGVTGAPDAVAADPSATKAKTKKKASSSAAASSSAKKAPVRATNSAVKSLDNLTGKAAQKAVDKLGKTIAVGGKAPKKDSKPAAAGGSFQEIG